MNNYVGYHGTSSSYASRITKTNFIINPKHTGWLGKGIYFFENDAGIAREYASNRHRGEIIKVIETEINILENKVFDTTTVKDRNIFHAYRRDIVNRIKEGKELNVKSTNSNNFDGRVYDIICKAHKYDLIRAETYTLTADDHEYAIGQSRVPNGIELCLKESRYVKDKKYKQ